MKTAKEILEMTIKESKLAKACDKFIIHHASYVEGIAMSGHRSARVDLCGIKEFGICCCNRTYTYEEVADILAYKLHELGYKTFYHDNHTMDICW